MCYEEPAPPESGCVSMEVHSEIGEENSTSECHEKYTAEVIEANYGRQVLTERYGEDVSCSLPIEKKRTQKITRLNTKTMKSVLFTCR